MTERKQINQATFMSKNFIIQSTESSFFWDHYLNISQGFQNGEFSLAFLDELQIEQGTEILDPIPRCLVQAHYLSHQCCHQGKALFLL